MGHDADILIIGAGPTGSIAAMLAAKANLRVIVVDKASHPRFHVGESMLPRTLSQLRDLGLEDVVRRIPHTVKLGASMVYADDTEPTDFRFSMGLTRHHEAFNIERAPFDAAIADAARAAGAEIRESDPVESIDRLAENDIAVTTASGQLRGRLLLDASGQGAVLGRHLKMRRPIDGLRKVAYFNHFTGVRRRAGDAAGMPIFALCKEAWMWAIPLDAERTSVGLVMDADAARRAGAPANQMLAWAIRRAPAMQAMMADCDLSGPNGVIADFSYTCDPYAGPGWAMLGDAATFIDPVFSTGVCLGMMGAEEVIRLSPAMLAGGAPAASARGQYRRYVQRASSQYLQLVRGFYTQAFRDLFMSGSGPLQVHRAVMAALAGDVFPRAASGVRWRLALFEVFRRVQEHVALTPRREPWSLLEQPEPVSGLGAAALAGSGA